MALALIDTAPAHNERSACTACKARHALQSAFIKDGLRPIDSVSSLDSVRIGSTPSVNRKTWDSSDSRSLYAVDGWGRPYFSVEHSGHLRVKTTGIFNTSCQPSRSPYLFRATIYAPGVTLLMTVLIGLPQGLAFPLRTGDFVRLIGWLQDSAVLM